MSYLFFLSYARDRDGAVGRYKRKFFDDLVQELKMRHVLPEEDQIGFLDEDIATGQVWGDSLADALKTCKVFVFLQEPTYFHRVWCGREWHVFRCRLEAAHAARDAAGSLPLMLPVIWLPTPELPALAGAIQNADREFGDEYVREGVFDLIRLRMKTKYIKVLKGIASRIVKAAREHPLPSLTELDPLDRVPNAFLQPPLEAAAPQVTRSPSRGSLCVKFAYIAARHDEIQQRPIRRLIDGYGKLGYEWKPYHPGRDSAVFEFAVAVAGRMRVFPDRIDFDSGDDLIRKLKAARDAREIVVLFVDAWSLHLDRYGQAMRQFCNENFRNSVVVVPLADDDETHEKEESLKGYIEEIFHDLLGNVNEPACVAYDRVLEALESAITERRGWLLRDPGTNFRPVLGSGPRAKPTITAVRTS